ncbi:hypothetical protein Tco_0997932 [Tanacetum coccineum]
MKSLFTQMETEVAKCPVDKKYFKIEKKELSLDNDRLLEDIICQDVMNVVMHADVHNVLSVNTNYLDNDNLALEYLKMENDRLMELLISQDLVHTAVNSLAAINDYKSMQQSFIDEYNETLVLKAEFAKKNDMIDKAVYNKLLKRCSRLKNQCISLEIKLQQSNKSFQTNRQYHNQDAPEIKEFFIINELQDQLKAKNELLIYVNEICPSTTPVSNKLDVVTPMNRTRKGVKSSTEASGSKPRSNTKKDRISQTSRSNKKTNKVEAQPRIAKSNLNNTNRISKIVCNENVKHSVLNVNSELVCATCHEYLEVVFQKHVCYVWNLDSDDLLSGSRDINLYTISLDDMLKSSSICLLSKVSKTKSWLWH